MINRLVFTAVLLTLGLAPGAAADVRYASPTGTGTDCSQGAPCYLTQAVTAAGAGDEIVVAPGEYPLGATLAPAVALTIHGSPGARPRIFGTGIPILESLQPLQISDLTLESTDANGGFGATASLLGTGSSAERVAITEVSSGSAEALRPGSNFTLRNSLLRASGQTGATALFFQAVSPNTSVVVRNVTALASAPTNSFGLGIFGTAGGQNTSIAATNVIVDAGVDASAGAAPGITAAINLFNSNFDSSATSGTGNASVTSSGGQSTPPAFVSAGTGDFHEAAGSGTIDAGLTDPANGNLDLDARPRTLNGKTDIGAYEFQPPTPPDKTVPRTTIGALRLRGRTVTFTLRCPVGETRCNWAYSLRSAKRVRTSKRARRKVVRLGSGSASAAGGKRVTATLKLSRKNVRLIKRLKRLRVRLSVTTTDAAGNKATRAKNGTLKAPKKRAKRR